MQTQRLEDYGIEIRQAGRELVPSWVASRELQEFFAQRLLNLRVLTEFPQRPLSARVSEVL